MGHSLQREVVDITLQKRWMLNGSVKDKEYVDEEEIQT